MLAVKSPPPLSTHSPVTLKSGVLSTVTLPPAGAALRSTTTMPSGLAGFEDACAGVETPIEMAMAPITPAMLALPLDPVLRINPALSDW